MALKKRGAKAKKPAARAPKASGARAVYFFGDGQADGRARA